MQTATGGMYWPIDPRPEDVNVIDIASSLSKLCRFGGHCKRFYSVAEHAVLVSYVVPPELALEALHHDDTEAYLVDVPRPLKRWIPGYQEIEHQNWVAIAQHFGLPLELDKRVKEADNTVLLAEKEANMLPSPQAWKELGKAAKVKVQCLPPDEACKLYLDRHFELLFERFTLALEAA